MAMMIRASPPRAPCALELVSREARSQKRSVSILFIHGINVGAWVWEQHFLDYFAGFGFDVHAVSLRGHGKSEGGEDIRHWHLSDYVDDLAAAVEHIGAPLVLAGHSLGGAVVQRYLRNGGAVQGMALLASVPPWGLGLTALRMQVTSPRLFQSMLTLSSGVEPQMDIDMLRTALFSAETPQSILDDFVSRAGPESPRVALDAQGWLPLAPLPWVAPPTFVLGGMEDQLIPADEVRRTALYYGCDTSIVPQVAHAFMLEERWEAAAVELKNWLLLRFG